ncbi:MAG: hypothetical protein FWE08_05830 [Oscillospiraceae bacterium]|nr:hypothetical protein [Oscillospiraceae bacterium]
MKKVALLLVLAILLVGTLAACFGESDAAAYRAWEDANRVRLDDEDVTFTAEWEVTFDLLAVDGAAIQLFGTHAGRGMTEVKQTLEIRDMEGAAVMGTDLIILDGVGYMNMVGILQHVINELFAEMGMDGIDIETFLGDYTHMLASEEDIEEIMAEIEDTPNITGAFSDETLRDNLTRDEDVFRIDIEGEAIAPYIAAVLGEMALYDIDVELDVFEMMGIDLGYTLRRELENFPRWLRNADLADARLVIERTRPDDDSIFQAIELYIPDRVAIRYESNLVFEEIDPILAPERYLTEDGLEDIMMEIILEAFASASDFDFEPGGGSGYPTRGRWVGNTFTSEYLGLTFTMPNGWEVATEEDLAELMDLGADFMDDILDLDDDFWDVLDDDIAIHDMMASNALTGSNVQIIYEKAFGMSATQIIGQLNAEMEDVGFTAFTVSGTTRIGDYDWHAVDLEMELFGAVITLRYFVSVENDFARVIIITTSDQAETIDEILDMFGVLGIGV